MSRTRWLAGGALVAALAVGAWQGVALWSDGRGNAAARPASSVTMAVPAPVAAPVSVTGSVPGSVPVSVDVPPTAAGATPMAERVAVIGFLNKRNGESRELTLKPGQATRVGDAIVRLRACERTASWEQDQFTGAFLQLDVEGTDRRWRRFFSGWVFKERPALNVVQHPVYDVWPKSCTMSFPAGGPDTVTPTSGASSTPSRASRASNAPTTAGTPATSPPTEAPSAEPSNAL